MTHNRNTGVHDGTHAIGITSPSFQFHSLTIGFLHDAAGIFHRVIDRRLVRHERHIHHHKRVPGTTADGFSMVYHVVNGHGQRILVAQHNVAQGVADKNHVDTGLVNDACRMVIIGC